MATPKPTLGKPRLVQLTKADDDKLIQRYCDTGTPVATLVRSLVHDALAKEAANG